MDRARVEKSHARARARGRGEVTVRASGLAWLGGLEGLFWVFNRIPACLVSYLLRITWIATRDTRNPPSVPRETPGRTPGLACGQSIFRSTTRRLRRLSTSVHVAS